MNTAKEVKLLAKIALTEAKINTIEAQYKSFYKI
jgi:hypothetical protein